jgi:hypothetical protein
MAASGITIACRARKALAMQRTSSNRAGVEQEEKTVAALVPESRDVR